MRLYVQLDELQIDMRPQPDTEKLYTFVFYLLNPQKNIVYGIVGYAHYTCIKAKVIHLFLIKLRSTSLQKSLILLLMVTRPHTFFARNSYLILIYV